MKYPHLFSPIKIGSMELPNRVALAPTDICSGSSAGEVTERVCRAYEEMARGGTGFVIVGASSPDMQTGRCSITALSVDQDYSHDPPGPRWPWQRTPCRSEVKPRCDEYRGF